jgi:hypothetical protein
MAEPLLDPKPYVDACIANLGGKDPAQIIAPRQDVEAVIGAALVKYLEDYLNPPAPVGVAVTVTGLDPDTAAMDDPDLTLRVLGTGFTPDTVILFNNGEEPTVFVSDTEVTTGVKPSTASSPGRVPVSVLGAAESFDFTFTAATPEADAASAHRRRRG